MVHPLKAPILSLGDSRPLRSRHSRRAPIGQAQPATSSLASQSRLLAICQRVSGQPRAVRSTRAQSCADEPANFTWGYRPALPLAIRSGTGRLFRSPEVASGVVHDDHDARTRVAIPSTSPLQDCCGFRTGAHAARRSQHRNYCACLAGPCRTPPRRPSSDPAQTSARGQRPRLELKGVPRCPLQR